MSNVRFKSVPDHPPPGQFTFICPKSVKSRAPGKNEVWKFQPSGKKSQWNPDARAKRDSEIPTLSRGGMVGHRFEPHIIINRVFFVFFIIYFIYLFFIYLFIYLLLFIFFEKKFFLKFWNPKISNLKFVTSWDAVNNEHQQEAVWEMAFAIKKRWLKQPTFQCDFWCARRAKPCVREKIMTPRARAKRPKFFEIFTNPGKKGIFMWNHPYAQTLIKWYTRNNIFVLFVLRLMDASIINHKGNKIILEC